MIDAAPTIQEDAKRELPNGWRWMRLGDVAEYINGRAFKPEDWETKGVPIIRIQNLNSVEAAFNYYTKDVESRYLVDDGDLLISWSASLDAYIWNRGPAILNQHIFKAVERVDVIRRDYLYFAVREAMTEIRAQVHGATMQHITRPEFESIRIPLPPLADQQRIAAILAEQLSAVEQARAAAKMQLAAAKELPAAYLRAMFESDEARGWEKVRLGELAIVGPDNGAFKRRHEFGRGVPFVNVSDLYRGLTINFNQVERVEASQDEQDHYGINSGDLFFCRSSLKREGIGWCAYASYVTEPTIFDCHVMRVRLDPIRAIPQYVAYYWQHPLVRQAVIDNSRTATMTTMNQEDLAGVEIPVPSLSIQKQLVALLAEKYATVDEARTAVEAQNKLINQLPAALLRRAFSGEL